MIELLNQPTNLLKTGAIFHIVFALFHLLFWKLFDWVQDLKKLSQINKSVMQILNLRLIFVFLIFAYISYFNTTEMLTTKLGQTLTIGIALFWGVRAIEQIFYFGVKKFASNLLLILFLSGAMLYGWIYYLSFKLS